MRLSERVVSLRIAVLLGAFLGLASGLAVNGTAETEVLADDCPSEVCSQNWLTSCDAGSLSTQCNIKPNFECEIENCPG